LEGDIEAQIGEILVERIQIFLFVFNHGKQSIGGFLLAVQNLYLIGKIVPVLFERTLKFLEHFGFVLSGFSELIPGIDLKGNQYPDHYQKNLSYGIRQILSDAMLTQEFLTDFSKE
jgi:hypothetical protein